MRILIANDDGIHAPGLRALAEQLAAGDAEVYVVAPDRERSATGHGLTLHKPLRAEPREGLRGVRAAWAVNGTPSDCVKLAFGALLPHKPDLVVSGINRGPNLGPDVLYSGTVSAAIEGSLLGATSLAVSLAGFTDTHYDVAAGFMPVLLRQLLAQPLPPRLLINVNVPCLPAEAIAGVRVTRLGVRRYVDIFEPRVDPRGRTYYWLSGEVMDADEHAEADVVAVREGYISVTPIHYDLTFFQQLETLRAMQLNGAPAAAPAGDSR